MKKLFLIIFVTISSFTLAQHYTHIYELRGLEDSLHNSHLFYRYGSLFTPCWVKNIYYFNTSTGFDTLFIWDSASDPIGEGCRGQFIYDYEFFNNDPTKFIYGGYDYYIDPAPLLVRYDEQINIPVPIEEIEISQRTDSLVYVAFSGFLLKSTDGGYNFALNEDSLAFTDNSMISLSKNNDSHIYGTEDNKLVRSEDDGYSYTFVSDYPEWNVDAELYYDADEQHIYGITHYSNKSSLLISNGNGNQFTWEFKFSYNGSLPFAYDQDNAGEIYYATGRQIFKSTDFGMIFNLYWELERKVTGLYKKSGTEQLYASTSLNIFKITPDSISSVLNKPISPYVTKFYPLTIGNKWVYDQTVYEVWTGDTVNSYYRREIIGDTTMLNGLSYFILNEYDGYLEHEQHFYERVDQQTAKVFRYAEDSIQTNREYLIDDLLVLIGDTILAYRYYPHILDERFTVYSDWEFTYDFGWNTFRIHFNTSTNNFDEFKYSLTYRAGLHSFYLKKIGLVTKSYNLKGCVLNGVLYGDTTVVSVENEETPLPSNFNLEQNYPNPFNPTTKIKFTIPFVETGHAPSVQLLVYDILGNKVATLVNEEKLVGEYEIEFSGNGLTSGVYFYQLRAGNVVETKKMLILK